jgi:RNA polymerase sigma-70 factor (ECF subfamily)
MSRSTPARLVLLPAGGSAEVSPEEDAELVRQAAEGLVRARGEIFRRHAPGLMKLLTRLLASTADAEDAVQDTFVVAFRDLSQLREPGRLGQWLRQIAVHQAHRRFRRRRLLSVIGFDSHVSDATLEQLVDPDLLPDARAELTTLDRILKRLSAADRMAWMLRYVEGCELTEVASLCGCSLATAKRRIAAAQSVIARHVQLEEGADDETP